MSKPKNVYIYEIPPVVLYEFTRLMDTLSHSDWMGFASRVASDQTELKLTERCEDRTSRLLHLWSCRNGTVSDLLTILDDLRMYRARDVILHWLQTCSPPSELPPSLPASQPPSLPPSQPFHSFPPSSPWHTPIKEYTKPVSEYKHLPLPGPPPQASQMMSTRGRKATALPEAPSSEPASLRSEDLYNSLSSCAMSWSFEEILRGTEDFSSARQIGEGGFGVVYRATMRNTDYAVKKLKEDSQLDWTLMKQSFKTEVEKLSLYRHPNILDLAGYCIGEGTHCLLYVFMPNGSLEDRLHCQDTAALSWTQRIGVLLGAAKALQFLHTCSPKVIHGDVKSSNILLGEHLEPKLGDFGLARLCQNPSRATGKTTTVAHTKNVRGTLAYLPDEYLKDGQLGVEIDIYSFGVVLLEVLTGRRALEITAQSKTIYLKDLVAELEDSGQSGRTGKHGQSESISTAAQHICRNHLDSKVATPNRPTPSGAPEIAQLACQCLHRRRKKRPPMDEIFKTLQDNYKDQTYTCRSTINISSELPQPPPPQTPTWTDNSVEALTSQLKKLGPQEDTYCCIQHVHSPSVSSKISSSGLQRVDNSKESLDMTFSQRSPCESDESQGFSQYFSSSGSSSISKGNIPAAAWCQGDGDYSSSGSQAGPSPISSASGLSSERIVVNSAKQELVHKMALYKKGLLSSSELFSCGSGSYVEESTQSHGPVESEEFEY